MLGPNSLVTKMFYHVHLLCHNKWSSLFPFSHGFCSNFLPLPLFFSLLDEIDFKVLSYICFIFYQKKYFLSYEKCFLFPLQYFFSLRYSNICNYHFHSDHRYIKSLWCLKSLITKLILWEVKIAWYWKLVNWWSVK